VPSRVTVVIPNWNGERFLELCLGSLRDQSFRDFETILVDNGSTDGSLGFVAERFPEVKTISLEENRGFAEAVNAGIKASATEFVALLNNDTEQDPGWLGSLVSAAERYPESGLFASKLVDFHDREVLDGAGDAMRLSGLPYRLGHGERDRGQFDKPGHVFGACAAAALYRLGTRNSLNLLVKDLPPSAVVHILPFLVLGQLTRLITAAATGALGAHLEGLAGAWRHLPLMLAKRAGVQKRKRVSDAEVRRLLRESSLAAAASIIRRLRDRVVSR
jgi:glycosyltransferase involved in cell wall biosynthesis